jgi:hypothetical protein
LGNAVIAEDEDGASGTLVCAATEGRIELDDVTVLDHDDHGVLLAASGENQREAWLATRLGSAPEGTRFAIRAPGCSGRRREFAGCPRLRGELASARVLLHFDRVVEVYDRVTGRSLVRRTIPGSGSFGDVELAPDGESVRIDDQRMLIPSGELTDIPEDPDAPLGGDPHDFESPPATLPGGASYVRCRDGAIEVRDAGGAVVTRHADVCSGNEKVVAGASSELVYTLESGLIVSLASGHRTRIRYALVEDGSVQSIVETSEGFVVPASIVEQYWYRPEGPAIATVPVPARGHVVLRDGP